MGSAMLPVLLLVALVAASYTLAYRHADDTRREVLRWLAAYASWATVTTAVLVTVWRA